MDLNTAEPQQSFGLIPKGTTAKVRMMIHPGGYNDPTQDWTGGYATCNPVSGTVYLNCEFIILDGAYAKRKVWSLIGLHSPKGDKWNSIGRSFMRAIVNSAKGFAEEDASPQAMAARKVSFADFDGIEFVARIDVEKDKGTGQERNVIKRAVTKGQKGYTGEEREAMEAVPSPDRLPSWAR
jgi:hypothetical protein